MGPGVWDVIFLELQCFDLGESIVGLYDDLTLEFFKIAELVPERLGTSVLIIGPASSVLSVGKSGIGDLVGEGTVGVSELEEVFLLVDMVVSSGVVVVGSWEEDRDGVVGI